MPKIDTVLQNVYYTFDVCFLNKYLTLFRQASIQSFDTSTLSPKDVQEEVKTTWECCSDELFILPNLLLLLAIYDYILRVELSLLSTLFRNILETKVRRINF